ncbi:hypothetical protein ACHQM5_008923 [Ranunculus cassubicifolius]
MDKRESKSSKKERVKLRKKLLENGTPIVTSESNLTDENAVKARREKKKNKLSGKKRKEQSLDASDVDHMDSHREDTPKKIKRDGTRSSHRVLSRDVLVRQKRFQWIHEYHQSRPGLKILQERIDDFIITHGKKLEQERKEREERAAEGGWTVVKHEKGRKKTTDADTGTAVGGVAQAAVLEKMGKKKIKDVGVDFYRSQKREAQRNEIMLLQSKFEEDKKRIQQLRAARKFRPY